MKKSGSGRKKEVVKSLQRAPASSQKKQEIIKRKEAQMHDGVTTNSREKEIKWVIGF